MGKKRKGRRQPNPPAQARPPSPASRPRTSSERRAPAWGACLLLALLVVGLYGRTVAFEFTRTDDKVLLVDAASFLEDLSNLPKAFSRYFFPNSARGEGYYRPLATITHMVDAQWRGVVPLPFHVTNTGVHVVAVCLLFVFLRRLHLGFHVSLFAAAMFAVHPALASAVAWIPGRADMLLGIGFLISAIFYLQYRETRGAMALAGHLAGFLVALLSKEAGVVIPLMFVAHALIVDRDRRTLRSPWLWTGWATVVALWAVLWLSAGGMSSGETVSQRLAVAVSHAHVLLMQLGKAVFPYKLSVLAIVEDTPWIPGAVILLLLIGAFWMVSGTWRRLYAWGLSVFVLFLLPTLPVSDYLISESRLYAATIGIVVSVGIGIEQWAARHSAQARWSRLGVAGVAAVLLAAVVSFRYSGSFRNPDTYTRAAVAASPHSGLAHLNRGIVLHLEGRLGEAEQEYQTALQLEPNQPILNNNMGVILLARAENSLAEQAFRKELLLNPSFDKAHFNLGLALRNAGRADEAADAWKRAVQLNPDNTDALRELFRYHQARRQDGDAAVYRAELARRGVPVEDDANAPGLRPPGAPPQAPAGGNAVPEDQVPRELLIQLYEQALQRDPSNKAIRQKYEELLRQKDRQD